MSTEYTWDQRDLIGHEIAGRIRIVSKLGQGGMGAVYRGEQLSLKRAVAVKVLRPELSANQQLQRRFETEAQAIAKLQHPNIVQVFDFGRDTDGSLFIAMEFIDGQSLRTVLAVEGPLRPARAFHIALQITASLIEAHAHDIVHRDLKPDNVMLQHRGREGDIARVLDFGIAKLRDDSRRTEATMTQAGDMLGTPQYMAPEQIRGEAIDGRCDIYALGCLIYEMVTACQPFEAPTVMALLSKHLTEPPIPPSQRRPDLGLPPGIDQVVLAAMAKDPDQRPATMEQYADMLAAVLHTLPQVPTYRASAAQPAVVAASTPQPPTPPPALTPPHPNKPSRLPLVLVALVVAGLAIWGATRSSSSPAPPASGDRWSSASRLAPRTTSQHRYSCDEVADKVLVLATQMLAEKLDDRADEMAELSGEFQKEAQVAHANVAQECTSKDWTEATRACFMTATSAAEAKRCR